MDNSDYEFLYKSMRYFDLKGDKSEVTVFFDKSKEKYPDIWLIINDVPTRAGKTKYELYVTQEWKSQDTHERRKRLVHEVIHMAGYDHWFYHTYLYGGHKLLYSTQPDEDSFSWLVYFNILHDIPRNIFGIPYCSGNGINQIISIFSLVFLVIYYVFTYIKPANLKK